MNRNAIIESVNILQAEIEQEVASNQSAELDKNYKKGIWFCREIVSCVSEDNNCASLEAVLNNFNRFSIDSLPWSGAIMEKYTKTHELIVRELRIKPNIK